MLKLVKHSSNKKTGSIAVTYRAGHDSCFGTCAERCPLNPEKDQSTNIVSTSYLAAVRKAVPQGGKAWTYTHFKNVGKSAPHETVINFSADSINEAIVSAHWGVPTVLTVEKDHEFKKSVIKGVRFVTCPAEVRDNVTCQSCGNGEPLCARNDRDYVVVFHAHGPSAKHVGTGEGGCYGTSGPVRLQWENTRKQNQVTQPDGEALIDWVKTLPHGSFLRHHVVGDLGIS